MLEFVVVLTIFLGALLYDGCRVALADGFDDDEMGRAFICIALTAALFVWGVVLIVLDIAQ